MEQAQSLFGQTPENLQLARNAALNASATDYAKMDPFERAAFGMYKGANQLGGAIGGMMGGQDPRMQLMQRRNSMLEGLDQADPQSWLKLAEKLSLAKDFAGAQEAVGRAQALRAASTKNRLDESTIGKNLSEKSTSEMKNAAALANNVAEPGTPEWATAFKSALTNLTAKPETRDQIKEVGVAVGSGKPVYTHQTPNGIRQVTFETGADGQQVMLPYTGSVDRTTSKIQVSATAKGAEAGAEQIAKLDAKRLSDASMASDAALASASLLQQLAKTPQTISGTAADSRVSVLRMFNTIGLTSTKDTAALQNADAFNSLAGENVLSFIKKLGVNPTDTDRTFALSIGPGLAKGTVTNQDIIKYLLGRANDTVSAASSMEKHFYANNYSLKGFESPLMKNLQGTTIHPGLAGMSLEQLKELQKSMSGGTK